jgi:hypothetical protein
MLKDTIPMFVKGEDKSEDHKCSTCKMRILRKGNSAGCTIINEPISLSRGTCQYWTPGKPSEDKDVKERQMTKKEAAYLESNEKVQCRTCRFYDDDFCHLWGGKVGDGDCCMAFVPGL